MSTLEKSLYQQVKVNSKTAYDKVKIESPTYKGFSTVASVDNKHVLYDIALIKQDIINHFHIKQGEKLSDPNFGTIIWDILFEPLTEQNRSAIIDNVTEIINYDPRVSVNQIIVDDYEQGILISCELMYLPYSVVERLQLRFDENAGFLAE